MIRLLVALMLLISAHHPALALTPEEQLANPVLEERARAISQQLRCLVCENQSIDDSDADLARDLRIEVRNLLTNGLSDAEIFARIRATHGDYVLLNPPVNSMTGLLWAAPFVFVIMGVFGFVAMRRRRPAEVAPNAASFSDQSSQNTLLSPKIAIFGVVLIVIITASLYAVLGRPDLTAQPLADREDEIIAAQTQQSLEDEDLKARLDTAQKNAAADENSVQAQLQLAMIAAQADAFDLELKALDRALTLTNGSAAIKAIKAEALARKAGGLVTIPARNLIAEVLAQTPQDPRALYLFGLAAYQDEDYPVALDRWIYLQSLIVPTSPLAVRVSENIADAANRAGVPVPESTSPLAIAENLSEEDRDAMIAGMVEGLETRLANNPQDAAGWDRLINARQVLEDQDGIIRALIGAASAFPQDMGRQVTALEAIVLEQREADYLGDALTLLDRINTQSSRGPQFLFFAGHFALISGEVDLAITLWRELAETMDDSNPIKSGLQDQIKALENS